MKKKAKALQMQIWVQHHFSGSAVSRNFSDTGSYRRCQGRWLVGLLLAKGIPFGAFFEIF